MTEGPVDLIAMREIAGLSRADLASKLGLSPTSGRVTISQMEHRGDWLLSRISAYIAALDGTAELVVTLSGIEHRFTVT